MWPGEALNIQVISRQSSLPVYYTETFDYRTRLDAFSFGNRPEAGCLVESEPYNIRTMPTTGILAVSSYPQMHEPAR